MNVSKGDRRGEAGRGSWASRGRGPWDRRDNRDKSDFDIDIDSDCEYDVLQSLSAMFTCCAQALSSSIVIIPGGWSKVVVVKEEYQGDKRRRFRVGSASSSQAHSNLLHSLLTDFLSPSLDAHGPSYSKIFHLYRFFTSPRIEYTVCLSVSCRHLSTALLLILSSMHTLRDLSHFQ